MPNYLAPIDLEDDSLSEMVIQKTVEMATGVKDAKIYLMTVIPGITPGIDQRYAIRGETGGSANLDMKKIVSDSLERLNDLVADWTPDGMKVRTIARRGSVYEQVLNAAEELRMDQIVIGAHRPGLADFLLGPNTARVVRHAKCSVNVIRL